MSRPSHDSVPPAILCCPEIARSSEVLPAPLRLEGGVVAVRSDRLMLFVPVFVSSGPAIAGTVWQLEYQGARVYLTVATGTGETLTLELPEAAFEALPVAAGASVKTTRDPATAQSISARLFCARCISA